MYQSHGDIGVVPKVALIIPVVAKSVNEEYLL